MAFQYLSKALFRVTISLKQTAEILKMFNTWQVSQEKELKSWEEKQPI